jgi:hypothetical protein
LPANKADLGFAVHRPNFDGPEVEIHVHKVRDKWVGKAGGVTLRYDRITGRYSEINRTPYSARYGDD